MSAPVYLKFSEMNMQPRMHNNATAPDKRRMQLNIFIDLFMKMYVTGCIRIASLGNSNEYLQHIVHGETRKISMHFG